MSSDLHGIGRVHQASGTLGVFVTMSDPIVSNKYWLGYEIN